MGASESILIDQKENGIFEINNKDYPIAYIRLCFDEEQKKYCIVTDCDIENKFLLKRKIIVVGMRLPGYDTINEQSFYLSSGLNSIEKLESFFKTKFDTEDCDSDKGCGLWIPFSGLGYESRRNIDENDIKLMKSYFNCSTRGPNCKYGRFGNYDPNLAQISYCLGGSFWDKNFDKIKNILDIKRIPTLNSYLEKIPCTFIQNVFKNNTECSIFVNCYIGSAVVSNYFSISQFKIARNTLLRYEKNDDIINIIKNIKFDWNIVYYSLIFPSTDASFFYNYLPTEDTFTANSLYFLNYLGMVIEVYKNNIEYFNEILLPFIELQNYNNAINTKIKTHHFLDNIDFITDKKKIKFNVSKKEIENKKEEDIEVSLSHLKLSTIELGTEDNPYSKRDDAKVGEYYLRGGKPVKKHK